MTISSLGPFLGTLEAQKAGELIAAGGQAALRELLSTSNEARLPRSNSAVVLACEVVAASIGHPRQDRFWCFHAENWLYRSKFVADVSFVSACRMRLGELSLDESDPSCSSDLLDLLNRLDRETVPPSRRKPFLSKADAKKLIRGFGQSPGDFGLDADSLVCSDIRIEEAVALTYLRSIGSLSLVFGEYPILSQIEAARILLHRFRASLTRIEVSAWLGPGRRPQPLTDPFGFWTRCLDEIAAVVNLEYLFSINLHATDDLVQRACQNGMLRGFRAKPIALVDLGEPSAIALLSCQNLKMVDVDSERFTVELRRRLRVAFPELVLLERGLKSLL